MRNFIKIRICLILVSIHKIQSFLVIGKIKNEFKGKIISEFVGLKSKMYFSTDVYNEEDKRASEVNKNNVKNKIHKKIS